MAWPGSAASSRGSGLGKLSEKSFVFCSPSCRWRYIHSSHSLYVSRERERGGERKLSDQSFFLFFCLLACGDVSSSHPLLWWIYV